MNNSNSLTRSGLDRSIFIVESKIGDNKYKIMGNDGTLREYVSNEALMLNEVICISMEEFKKPSSLDITDILNTSSMPEGEREMKADNETQITTSLASNIPVKPQKNIPVMLDLSSSRPRNIAARGEKEDVKIITEKVKNAKKKKPVLKIKPVINNEFENKKNTLLVDREQDKNVLRYIKKCRSMNPQNAVKFLLEANKIQSVFALYELFYDSRNGGDFGAHEFTDQFITSTINAIPKRRIFQGIRKLIEADLLKKGSVPNLDDIRKRGWRAYNIISFKIL